MNVHPLTRRTARYTVVGAICAVANNAVMIFGSWAGGHYIPLALLSFIVVTPLGYLLHAKFSFMTSLSVQDFLRFSSGVAAGFPLYFIIMATLCSGLGLAVALAAPISTVAMYIWNYASAHWAMRGRLRLR